MDRRRVGRIGAGVEPEEAGVAAAAASAAPAADAASCFALNRDERLGGADSSIIK